MSGSSGVNVYTRTVHKECPDCTFVGLVDQFVDPESHSTLWECPNGHVWEASVWDEYDEGDDR